MKKCNGCDKNKELCCYSSSSSSIDGLQYYCKECQSADMKIRNSNGVGAARTKNWRLKNPDKIKIMKRNEVLKRRYGIDQLQYELLLTSQNNVCAICKKPESMVDKRTGKPRRLAVDHCKITSKIRGLLCKMCNTGIGSLNHDTSLLNESVLYLNRSKV